MTWTQFPHYWSFVEGIHWYFPAEMATHYTDVIMSAMVSQNTSIAIVYSTVYSGADQRKHQSSESLTFVQGFHRWLVNSLHKWPVMWKMFTFEDIIMCLWSVCMQMHRNLKMLMDRWMDEQMDRLTDNAVPMSNLNSTGRYEYNHICGLLSHIDAILPLLEIPLWR